MRQIILVLLVLLSIAQRVFPQKRAITVEDLWAVQRIGTFTLSPDGQWIAYTSIRYDMETNASSSDIYLVSSMGGTARQITTHPAYDGSPSWSPDGTLLAFLSDRGGSQQIYAIPMDGGEAQQISSIPTGMDDFIWSPDGRYFAFTTNVYPELSSLDSSAYVNRQSMAMPIKARTIDRLFYRHWNRWLDDRRSHLFVMPSTGGKPWDLTPGDFDTPPIALGSHRDFAFSPDGREIAFVRNTDADIALSTNNDIFIVPTSGGTIRRITPNPANDNQPVYSPDGKYIAYRATRKPGFESDQYDLMLYNRKTRTALNLTSEFDLDVEEIVWAPSSDKIYYSAGDQKSVVIFSVEIKNGKIKVVTLDGCNRSLCTVPDDDIIYFKRSYINLPEEIFCCNDKGEETFQITFVNQNVLSALEMNTLEDFWFPSFDGRIVHGLLLKPPFFDPAKTYPAILLIHGGPQGAWRDEFHYRWNAQMFAARGYIVIMINFRGSKGYGQEFCNAVSKNWGNTPYRDLTAGLDYALKKFECVQAENIAVAGGSYGGFMVNWMAGHTDRFKCFVSHAGIFDPVSFYGATEELWFPEWEFEGTPYANMKNYERWSPVRYVKSVKTPTLVIHGEKDFRVPVGQGLQMFTALQRLGVPSRLLYFPDEGHFITKPQNARLWWETVLDWIDHWIQESPE